MFLNAKKMAFLGILLAVTVLLVILSGVIETNSLFLLAAASFGVGIAIRESGFRFGLGFFIASVLLSFILAPNKFYIITFSAMGLYLILSELSWEWLAKLNTNRNRSVMFWCIKLVIFNLIYIPIILFLPRLIYQGDINTILIVVFILGGQIGLLIYDKSYYYFHITIWNKMRKRFGIGD